MIHQHYFDHVPLQCIYHAADKYHLQPKVLAAVLETEGGRNGKASRNRNGTYDYGVMQINSTWIPTLRRMGYTRSELLNDPCQNLNAGAWLLKQGINESRYFWVGVGNYNSHDPYFNARYRSAVYRHYREIRYI